MYDSPPLAVLCISGTLFCRWMLDTLFAFICFKNNIMDGSFVQLRHCPQHCVTTNIPEDEWIDYKCMATSVIMPTQVLKLVSRGAQNGHSDLKLYHQLLAFGLCVTIRTAHHIISCCGKFLVFISQPQVKKAKPSRLVKHNVIEKTLSYQLLQAKVPFSKGGSPLMRCC